MSKFLTVIILSLVFNSSYAQEHKDCNDALMLCGESPFTFEVTGGIGNEDTDVLGTCVVQEFASTWIALNTLTDGDLIFELTPMGDDTDLDFLVFKLESNDCESKMVIRCMASGESSGVPTSTNEPCLGSTGLAYGETDLVEEPGCSAGDNNFLAPIIAEAGDNYILMVNNFSQSEESFELELGGTAQLDCIVASTNDVSNKQVDPLFNISQEGSQLLIKTNAWEGQGKLQLYTLNGATVHEADVYENEVVSINKTMPSGTYILLLKTPRAVYTEKVIVVN